MDTLIPLILIGLGSAAIVVGRDGRVLVGGLGVQWLGVAWATLTLGAPAVSGGTLPAAIGEGVAAVVCVAIMWLTLGGLEEILPEGATRLDSTQVERLKRADLRARRRRQAQMGAVDQLWPLVIALAGGMAGFALARLYPLGESEGGLLAFYWVALSGLLALVIDGARDPLKLAVGLFALLNGAFLLANTLGLEFAGGTGAIAIGVMAGCRIGLATLLTYNWGILRSAYNEVDLTPLFESRSEAQVLSATSALVTTGTTDESSQAHQQTTSTEGGAEMAEAVEEASPDE